MGAIKHKKIEILLNGSSSDPRIQSSELVQFINAGLVISGDYLIVVTDEKGENGVDITTTGKIFPLNQVKAYKTY
jgi:phosphopantetheinyl transferase